MAFERVPLAWEYEDLKSYFSAKTDGLIKSADRSASDAVDISLDYFFGEEIEENGMNRVAVVIIAFIYAIEHDDVASDLAFAVKWHIEDFVNGDYESLFNEKDLKLFKEDMQTAKEYLKTHS